MPNPQLQAGQFANGQMQGLDSAHSPAPLSSLVGVISDNTNAYLAAVPSNGKTAYCVVAKSTLPSGTTTVTVTWSGKSMNGTSVTSDEESYDLVGSGTVAPEAVSIGKASEGFGSGTPPATDPSTKTVTFI